MTEIRTADRKTVTEGDRVFNFYDLKWGTIVPGSVDRPGTYVDTDGPWFTVAHEDGTSTLLNGERISTANLTGMNAR